MITYKQIYKQHFFMIIFVIINFPTITNAFSAPKMISHLWEKKETEEISKNYSIKPNSSINITNINGNINIVGHNQEKIEIKAIKIGWPEEVKNTNIIVKTNTDSANITTRLTEDNEQIAAVDYIITVPYKSNLTLKVSNIGNVKVKNITGTIDIFTADGSIEVDDSIETVNAKTSKGKIKVTQKEFAEPHTIFLETQKGDISLSLSKQAQANIQAKAINGLVTSEQEITLEPQTVKLNKETWNRFKKEVKGTLNSGGGFITLEVTKGNIYLKEYLQI